MSDAPAPLRAVVSAQIRAGRGSLLGPDTHRRKRFWRMRLECGHVDDRDVKYRPLDEGERPIRGGQRNRPMTDALPAPKMIRCWACQAGLSMKEPGADD